MIPGLLSIALLAAQLETMRPIPTPDLSRLESAVQGQLRFVREQTETILLRPQLSASERASAYGELGRLYHAYEIWDAAEICYRNAALLTPGEFDWLYLLAAVQQHDGRLTEAADQYRRCLALRPKDTRALLRLAEITLTEGDAAAAEQLFMTVMRAQPESVPALAGIGKSALAQRDYRRAIERLERVLDLEPSATSLHYPLGLAWRAVGDIEKAQMHLARRGPGQPSLADPLLDELATRRTGRRLVWMRGWLALRNGDSSRAASAFREMIAMEPAEPTGYLELGRALFQQRAFDEARKNFSEAVKLDPNNAQAHYDLAVTLARVEEHASAVQHFEHALRLSPEMNRAHFHLANELLRDGRFEDAWRHYERAGADDPNNALARLMEAVALARLGRYSQARSQLQKAAETFPDNSEISLALARVLACSPQSSPPEAAKSYALAQAILNGQTNPGFAEVETLAMTLAATGEYEKAVRVQEAILTEVRAAGREDLAKLLEGNLRRYREGRTCAVAWTNSDPIFRPEPASLDPAPSRF